LQPCARHLGVPEEKLAAIWEYRTSPLFSEAERAALDFALAAAAIPNDVTDAMFAGMRRYWTDDQMVEIVGVISFFGFMNRWNDTMATPLEGEAIDVGNRFLAKGGWSVGRHAS
jgi:alkylhydroperoxidase family enzyme